MARILIIDDEDAILTVLRRRLERLGLEVTSASTADDGIRLLQTAATPYDVIVTDMTMEAADSGLKVLAAAVARDVLAAVIVVTAYGSVGGAVECMRRGAFDYLEKNNPAVDVFEELPNKIEAALERRRHDLRTLEKLHGIHNAETKP